MDLQKVTTKIEQHGKWYADACGTAFAMELVGERWSMLIIRELMLGGRRFSDLRASLPGISAKVLTERLGGLEQAGVVIRSRLPPPASVQVYELTEWGYLAEPAMQELGRWAARSPEHNPQLPLSPVSLMLSLRTMIVREEALKVEGTFGFEIEGQGFIGELSGGELAIRRGDPAAAQATFRMDKPLPFLRVIYGHQPLDDIAALGELMVEGDRALARAFSRIFSLPPKAALVPAQP